MPRDRSGRDEQVMVMVGRVIRTSDKAALCEVNGDEHWIPWSLLDKGSEIESVGDSGIAYVPRWFAQRNRIEFEGD